MGLGIGLVSWRSGYRVLLYDYAPERLQKGRQDLEKMNAWMTNEFPEVKATYGQLDCVADLNLLAREAELIVEAVTESIEVKVTLFRSLAAAADRGAIFCSCTSSLSISEMGSHSGFPRQVVGTHFWNPPHLMPLVEIAPGSETGEETVDVAAQFCRRIGKRCVRLNLDTPGFIGNRMLHALWREAIDIVESGIGTPEDVDTVARLTFGLRLPALGPLENMDLVGLDLVQVVQGQLLPELASNQTTGELLKTMVGQRRLGSKSGRGFYDWTTRDPQVLIESRDRQIVREVRRLKENE